MQHGLEKGGFGRFLDISRFEAGPLIGMLAMREREIPGREPNGALLAWGNRGEVQSPDQRE